MEGFNLLISLASEVTQLPSDFTIATHLISSLSRDEIRHYVQVMNTMIALSLYSENYKSKTIRNTINVMDIFYNANLLKPY